ncbi:MAG: IspD/TarI family cytidylyltransferase [Acidobacteriota bacterium]|nr:IspD/TarI family cytidylyltransferase [Acidobacteriota bacterium]
MPIFFRANGLELRNMVIKNKKRSASKMKTAVIILAGGHGTRCGFPRPKQFLLLGGRPLIDYSVEKFLSLHPGIIIAVLVNNYQKYYRPHPGISLIAPGGKERQASVLNGLSSCPAGTELVIIHDAARPFFPLAGVRAGLQLLANDKYDGLALASPAVDSLVEVNDGEIVSFPDRKKIYQTQTPQLFQYPAMLKACQKLCGQKSFAFTDDLSVAYAAGLRCSLVEGSQMNFKITTRFDWELAGQLLKTGF